MKGYIKLHRSILDWEWYRDKNTKNVFIHLLLNACFDKCKFMGVSVKKGQYITSLTRLSKDLDIPIRQLRTSLKRLQRTGEITTDATNKYTLITIANYSSYQVEESVQKKPVTIYPTNNDKYHKECLSNSIWIEQVCMNQSIDKDILHSALKKFHEHLSMTSDFKRNMREYKTHFINWIKYNKKEVQNTGGIYKWKWKGQALKSGTKRQLEKDKTIFDKPGFEFKILSYGN